MPVSYEQTRAEGLKDASCCTAGESLTSLSFEQTLIEVWRQMLVEKAKTVQLGEAGLPVRCTSKRGLGQVDFTIESSSVRWLEQIPQTKSR